MSFAIGALGLLAGNPVAGVLLDGYSWIGPAMFCGAANILSAAFIFAARIHKTGVSLQHPSAPCRYHVSWALSLFIYSLSKSLFANPVVAVNGKSVIVRNREGCCIKDLRIKKRDSFSSLLLCRGMGIKDIIAPSIINDRR
jgi:hypothetical protein